jgi:hypothetical protein
MITGSPDIVVYQWSRNPVSLERLITKWRFLKKPGFSNSPITSIGTLRNRVSIERLITKSRFLKKPGFSE